MADAPLDHPNLACAIEFYEIGFLRDDEIESFLARLRENLRIEGEFLAGIDAVLDLRPFPGWPPVATLGLLVKPSLDRVLADLASRREALPISLVFRWVGHLFEATEALHGGYRLVHRDLKPENVVLRLDGDRMYRGIESLERSTALLGHLASAQRIGDPAPRWWVPDLEWADPAGMDVASPAEDLYALGKILERLLAMAEEPSPGLADVAKGLTAPHSLGRMAAKQELRGLLFPARPHAEGESAVIARLSAAEGEPREDSGTTPTHGNPTGLNWAEFEGVPGYAILAAIGAGGMGMVFKARDLALNRLVAIKTMASGFSTSALERFHRESQILARLNHPNIVRLYNSGGDSQCPFLVLELVSGSTLSQRVAEKGPVPPSEAARILQVVAEAVAYAHDCKVLHRDIKPSNIILGPEGKITLLDFGLAKLFDGTPPITADGMTMGTVAYMSPEQFAGTSQVGPATDVFGLGATLYYALTGRSPRRARTLHDLWEEVEQPTRPPREFNSAIPPKLEAIVLKCLALRPGGRFASAHTLVMALRRFREGRSVALHISRGPDGGNHLPLDGELFILGRDPACHFVIPGTWVSRRHAQIVRLAGQFFIEDNHSRNGTFVNDQRIEERTPLKHNDRIRICDWIATLVEQGEDSSRDEWGDDFNTVEASLEPSSQAVREALPTEKLRLLAEIAESLSRVGEPEKLLPQIADSLFQVFRQADRCFIEYDGDKPNQRVVKIRRTADDAVSPFSQAIVRKCMNESKAFLSTDDDRDDRSRRSRSAVENRIRSVMCAPLIRADGRAFGVIQLDTQDHGKKFEEDDLKLLCNIANQASISMENARLSEETVRHERDKERTLRDLHLTKKVQESFRPSRPPELPGYEFWSYCKTTRTVGGDFYDYLPLPGEKLAIFVGDAAGHGVSTSLLVNTFLSACRYLFPHESSPEIAVAKLNDIICRSVGEMHLYITLSAVVLDPAKHSVTLVSAGQPLPLLWRSANRRFVDGLPPGFGSLPLGVQEGTRFATHSFVLRASESLILFTNGVTDAADKDGHRFGMKRLREVIQATGKARPQELGERIDEAVKRHAAGKEPADDMTIVVVRRR